MALMTNESKLCLRGTVFKRETNAVRRAEYKQFVMAIFALSIGKADCEAMSSATGSNGRMAQLGPGHRISSQLATRENISTATWKKIYINLAAYRHLSQLI